MLTRSAISWKSSEQSLVSISTMEVEIVVCFKTRAHAKWLRNFIFELKIVNYILKPLRILSNNSSIVLHAKNTKNIGGASKIY